MLTPIFDITQDDDYLNITIRAPHCKISDTEVQFEDYEFRFYSKPYFLRLTFPCKVIENGNESAKYDCDNGEFIVKVPKQNCGEYFDGLNMITKLMTPLKKSKTIAPLIEVIDNEVTDACPNDSDDDSDGDGCGDDSFEWHFEQQIWHESDDRALMGESYGFANQKSGICARISEEICDVIDLRDAEHKTPYERRNERLEAESLQFSDDHYLSDLYDEQKETIDLLINFKADWDMIETCDYEFTIDEKYRMKNLPNKEYINDKRMNQSLFLGIVDILYAYAYNYRTTEGEYSVESVWTICKLSATLSWFETFHSLRDVIIYCMRRSLCYPLYRNWELSLKVLEDTCNIIRRGRSYVLKCFLDIHNQFNVCGDSRYILNDLYITDYCVWIQQIKSSPFESLASAISKMSMSMSKDYVQLDLDIVEKAAKMAIQERNVNESDNTDIKS